MRQGAGLFVSDGVCDKGRWSVSVHVCSWDLPQGPRGTMRRAAMALHSQQPAGPDTAQRCSHPSGDQTASGGRRGQPFPGQPPLWLLRPSPALTSPLTTPPLCSGVSFFLPRHECPWHMTVSSLGRASLLSVQQPPNTCPLHTPTSVSQHQTQALSYTTHL